MLSRFITTAWFAWVAVYLLTACSKQRSASVEGVADVASGRPKSEQIWFEEIAAKAGFQFHYQSGHRPGQFYIPEIMGGGVGLLDYDHDGNLDLVAANYIKWSPDREIQCFSRGGKVDYCSPMDYKAPAMVTLWHNRGDGTFEDVTVAAGLDKVYGNGLGVAIADFDHNGWLDVYVAHDAMPNQLWLNQGNGKFKEEAMFRGCAVSALGVPEAGMGVVAVDLMQRGCFDLFITHLVGEAKRLFLNTNDFFLDWVHT